MKRTVISATDWRFDKPERKPLSESSDLTDHLTEMTEVAKVVKRSVTVDDTKDENLANLKEKISGALKLK